MVTCCIRGCDVSRRWNPENYTFHRLPLDPYNRQKWIRVIGRPNWVPKRATTICSKHFEEKYIRKRNSNTILSKDAIPTLFVPVSLYTEDTEQEDTSVDGTSDYVHDVSQTSDQDTCALYCNLLHNKLKSLNKATRDIAMMEIDRIMYILKQQDNNTMTSQRQLQAGSSKQQRGTSDLSSNSFLKRKGINNEEYLIKKIRQDDGLDHLFMSYAKTFRKLSSKKQAELKVQQAKMFADAELSDLQNDAKVGISDQNSATCSVYVSITELPEDGIKKEPVTFQSEYSE